MGKVVMVNVDLIDHGLDCKIDVPADMFFELIEIVPNLLGRFGIEKSEKEYSAMLAKIKSESKTTISKCWNDEDIKGMEFLRRCQMVAVVGAYLHDIPLKITGGDLTDYMNQVGGINVTDQVDAGLIPVECFGQHQFPR